MGVGNKSNALRVAKTIFTTSANGSSTPQMLEAAGFTKWTFMIDGNWAGASVTIMGTIDGTTSGSLITPGTGSNWFQLSPVSGGGNNPITTNGQQLQYNNPLLAVQAVVSGLTSGTVNVLALALP